jgi:hypothetical protein
MEFCYRHKDHRAFARRGPHMRVPKAMEVTFAFGSLFLECEQSKLSLACAPESDSPDDTLRNIGPRPARHNRPSSRNE